MALMCTIICGFILGLERELKHKEVGLKILVFIALGAYLFTTIGRFIGAQDRIIAQVVSGIGFFGSGVIIFNRDKLSGLSSAAMIWLCAAIGVLNGIGLCFEAVLISIGIVLVGGFIDRIRPILGRISNESQTDTHVQQNSGENGKPL